METCCDSCGPFEMPGHPAIARPTLKASLSYPVVIISILTNEFVGSKRRGLTFDVSRLARPVNTLTSPAHEWIGARPSSCEAMAWLNRHRFAPSVAALAVPAVFPHLRDPAQKKGPGWPAPCGVRPVARTSIARGDQFNSCTPPSPD